MTIPRRTIHTAADDYVGAKFDIPENPDVRVSYMERARELSIRSILRQMDDLGFTVHREVVEALNDHDIEEALNDAFNPNDRRPARMTYQFPPVRPRAGNPCRIDGGPAHGHRFPFDSNRDMTRMTVMPDHHMTTVTATLTGFDTATGEWVYASTPVLHHY